jgi:hypothetical protein
MEALFGSSGPSAGEKAMQRERYEQANRAEAEADTKVALAARVGSLRKALSFRDKKERLGG